MNSAALLVGTWQAWVLRGAALILFGGLTIVWPQITLAAFIALFGAIMLVDGAFGVIGSLLSRGHGLWWLTLVGGLLSAGVGVAIFAWPHATALVLLYLIATWAVVTGILIIIVGLLTPRENEGKWWLAFNGFVSLVFGILLFAWPATGALAITWLIGAYALLFGLLLVALGFGVRRTGRQQRAVT